jgi:hypothetical protein
MSSCCRILLSNVILNPSTASPKKVVIIQVGRERRFRYRPKRTGAVSLSPAKPIEQFHVVVDGTHCRVRLDLNTADTDTTSSS